ncbi:MULTISPECIES: hypothetical protein [unclassified Rhizobium]|uniref:hypothetical protein n=1 Tax=unclassified Rhizobium TaxID=2613769 RepID=UPI001ADB8A1C|nr:MULTISPECIES: hypothetical protein [unclassified Rhizobium]MBO9127941.1 hypothetical protein [Rhizobium sp. 16-488-2b]MBO9178518.1 hypothetical protein [Rhizobium sp. 16-488-2a]
MRGLFVLAVLAVLGPRSLSAQEAVTVMPMNRDAFENLQSKGIAGLDPDVQNAIAALLQNKGCPNCVTGTIDPAQPLLKTPPVKEFKKLLCRTDKNTGVLICDGERVSIPSAITTESVKSFFAAITEEESGK